MKYLNYTTRNQMPIQNIEISQDFSLMAVASSEDEIKLIHLNEENKSISLKGHEGGCIAVSFDPKGKYLASAGRDGSIKIWEIKTEKEVNFMKNMIPKEIIKGVLTSGGPIAYKIQWTLDGKYLIAPAGEKGVLLIEREKWTVFKTIKHPEMKLVYMIAYSNINNMVAAVDNKKQCFLFDTETSFAGIELYREMDGEVTSLIWSPFDSSLIIVSVY
jgi:WD40 repeat protein